MAWCFSTRASVATVPTMHPCVSRCLRVKYAYIKKWDMALSAIQFSPQFSRNKLNSCNNKLNSCKNKLNNCKNKLIGCKNKLSSWRRNIGTLNSKYISKLLEEHKTIKFYISYLKSFLLEDQDLFISHMWLLMTCWHKQPGHQQQQYWPKVFHDINGIGQLQSSMWFLIWFIHQLCLFPVILMGMGLANERRRYSVTSSLIGGAHTHNYPWFHIQ